MQKFLCGRKEGKGGGGSLEGGEGVGWESWREVAWVEAAEGVRWDEGGEGGGKRDAVLPGNAGYLCWYTIISVLVGHVAVNGHVKPER